MDCTRSRAAWQSYWCQTQSDQPGPQPVGVPKVGLTSYHAPQGARHRERRRVVPYWILDPIRFPKKGGRVRGNRGGIFG